MTPEREGGDAAALAVSCRTAAGFVALVGLAGSGKSRVLRARAAALAAEGSGPVLLSSANRRAAAAMAADPLLGATPNVKVRALDDLALDVLRAGRFSTNLSPDLEIVPDARAARIFEEIGRDLFALDWTEFVSPEIDPEITGLRAPERFAAAAFRLIRRLRGAGIGPERFHTSCLQGATEFYGRLPNFGDPDLKSFTKPKYRDSLLVTPEDLERQRRSELDLARILHRLYDSYERSLVDLGCMTPADAIFEASRFLERSPQVAERLRKAYPRACVDDAQDLTQAHLALLRATYGTSLSGVTFAGDARQTSAFARGAGDVVFRGAAETFVLEGFERGRAAIANVALRGLDPRAPAPARLAPAPEPAAGVPCVVFARGRDVRDEARIVAEFVHEALRDGTPANEIAVVVRSLASAPPYLDALLARGVPCDLAGEGSLFDHGAVLDVLGALWALADPFRHDYLMRDLEAPWMRLADASIARLCAEPSQPQTLLFEMPEEPVEGRNRWDRRRDFRLARNVTRGDADLDLTPVARERIDRFRAALARWQVWERDLDVPALVRAIAGETVLATAPPGARGDFERAMVARFFAYVDAFSRARPLATLHDLLDDIDALMDRDEALLSIDPVRTDAVSVLDIDAAKGREFDLVLVVDVRAGAFPRYYAPDAFFYTPKLGIVPKENLGDGADRTAKFTYAMWRTRAQERFLEEERRAFYVAATRARARLVVSASGKATKGVAAPEILEELRRAGLPGTADLERPGTPPSGEF